jgi:hypothetical protein
MPAGTLPIVTTYREQLTVPWWAWPAGVAAAAFLAAELAIGAVALRVPVTFVVAGALAVGGLFALSRIRVAVADGQLRVDDARLPTEFIASVEVLDAAGKRDLLGPGADPLAFVIQRPWISGGVRVNLNDPADPTPYWFISSRAPQRLASALTATDR